MTPISHRSTNAPRPIQNCFSSSLRCRFYSSPSLDLRCLGRRREVDRSGESSGVVRPGRGRRVTSPGCSAGGAPSSMPRELVGRRRLLPDEQDDELGGAGGRPCPSLFPWACRPFRLAGAGAAGSGRAPPRIPAPPRPHPASCPLPPTATAARAAAVRLLSGFHAERVGLAGSLPPPPMPPPMPPPSRRGRPAAHAARRGRPAAHAAGRLGGPAHAAAPAPPRRLAAAAAVRRRPADPARRC